MADKKRYEVVRSGPVGGHAPGEQFSADPESDQVKFWVQIGAVKAVAVQSVKKEAGRSR